MLKVVAFSSLTRVGETGAWEQEERKKRLIRKVDK
jgi:hypothetical protein